MDADGVDEVLARTGVELLEQLLRADGSLPPPTVYLLTKFLPDPYPAACRRGRIAGESARLRLSLSWGAWRRWHVRPGWS